jgi:hypothetical protein
MTHQLLAYANYVNLLGDNIDTTKKSTETLTDASKKVGVEINAEKTKYMLLSRHQNAGQNQNKKKKSIIIWSGRPFCCDIERFCEKIDI